MSKIIIDRSEYRNSDKVSEDNGTLVSFYIPSFERGGVERLVINLSRELVQRDVSVDVLVKSADPPINQLHDDVNVVWLEAIAGERLVKKLLPPHVANAIVSLPSYIRYLRSSRPDLSISMQTSPFAVLGARIARTDATVVVRESNTPSVATEDPPHRIGKLAPIIKKLTYPRADHVVAVSREAADDIVDALGLSPKDVTHIYNPTYNPEIVKQAEDSISHPWFDSPDIPVVVSVGRFSDQKDFETLLEAIASIRSDRPIRLVLVGDGENRERLEQVTKDLAIEEDVDFVGYQSNPYKYMAWADLFVLSSHYEGLPNVLIEALGVGTPAIATDCPSGPQEILLDGKGGTLVPVGDEQALAEAIVHALENPAEVAERLAIARDNLDRFRPERAADEYLSLLDDSDG